MSDIRIDTDLPSDPRWRRLARALGGAGLVGLIQLWIYTRRHHPSDGVLGNLTDAEIAQAAGWRGRNPSRFVAALCDGGWLLRDRATGVVRVVDWAEMQPHAVGARQRSRKAREAAKARWDKTAEMHTASAAQLRSPVGEGLEREVSSSEDRAPLKAVTAGRLIDPSVVAQIGSRLKTKKEIAAERAEAYVDPGPDDVEVAIRERAAIHEVDGGLTRAEAERRARGGRQ